MWAAEWGPSPICISNHFFTRNLTLYPVDECSSFLWDDGEHVYRLHSFTSQLPLGGPQIPQGRFFSGPRPFPSVIWRVTVAATVAVSRQFWCLCASLQSYQAISKTAIRNKTTTASLSFHSLLALFLRYRGLNLKHLPRTSDGHCTSSRSSNPLTCNPKEFRQGHRVSWNIWRSAFRAS